MLTRSSPSSSLADKVASNDDLLTEILFRLPVRSLIQFMSVSKHWYSLIANPSFKLRHSRNHKPNLPSGLFFPVQIKKPDSVPYVEWKLIPFNIDNIPVKSPFKTPNLNLVDDDNVKRIIIYDSSNGVMLCSNSNNVYLYNPTINQNQFTTIPELENHDISERLGMKLIFDPSTSPHYTIIYVSDYETDIATGEDCCRIELYSSETRTSRLLFKYFPEEFEGSEVEFGAAVVWNNAVHWVDPCGFILFFNFDGDVIRRIHTPPRDDRKYISNIVESRGHLLIVEVSMPLTSKFKIYELNNDYSSWFVKYDVDLEILSGSFPEMLNPAGLGFSVLCIELGEENEEDSSFLVLEINGKAVRFNLESKTFYKLDDLPLSQGGGVRIFPPVFKFVESLYCF